MNYPLEEAVPQLLGCGTQYRKRLANETQFRYLDMLPPMFRIILRLTGNSRWMGKGSIVRLADVVAGHDIKRRSKIERLTEGLHTASPSLSAIIDGISPITLLAHRAMAAGDALELVCGRLR